LTSSGIICTLDPSPNAASINQKRMPLHLCGNAEKYEFHVWLHAWVALTNWEEGHAYGTYKATDDAKSVTFLFIVISKPITHTLESKLEPIWIIGTFLYSDIKRSIS